MPISTACPGCGKTIGAPDSAAGHKAHCPHCGAVVEIRGSPTAALAAALGGKAAPPSEALAAAAAAAERTPSAIRNGSASASRLSTTTIDRMIAKTSPYDTLRLLGAILFGVGVTVGALLFVGGLAALIFLSVGGQPFVGAGVFCAAFVLAVLFLLGAKTAGELVRLWADVGDRVRQVAQMVEESLNRPRDASP